MFPFQKGNLCFNNVSNKNNKQHAINYIANDVPNYNYQLANHSPNYESQYITRENPRNSLKILDQDNTPCNSNDSVNHHQGKMISCNNDANYIANDANDVPNYNYQLANHSPNYESQYITRENPRNSLKNLDQDNTPCNSNDSVNHHQGKMISCNNDANKRVIHRETERQRRQEMANLYSSLCSILPLDYVKGKRSMSDHICEATKYIKDLKKNINELETKRNNLKNTCCSSSTTINNHSSSSRDEYNVSIYAFSKAIEIEICSRLVKQEEEEDSLSLSKVVKVLNEQGFDVVSRVSSKLNSKWVYIIHCQVEDVASIDSCQLQWRLKSEINN